MWVQVLAHIQVSKKTRPNIFGSSQCLIGFHAGVLLLVDSVEGPMPQTRFVLRKSLALNKKVIVVVNKIDRDAARYANLCPPCNIITCDAIQRLSVAFSVTHSCLMLQYSGTSNTPKKLGSCYSKSSLFMLCQCFCRPDYVIDTTFELFCELGASDEQCDFPAVYASGVNGTAGLLPTGLADDLEPLFEAIVKEIQPPAVKLNSPLQMLVTNLDYDDHKGRIAIGRVSSGCISKAEQVSYLKPGTPPCSCLLITPLAWVARYNTWLLIRLTPEGAVFSFLLLPTSFLWHMRQNQL